MSTKAKITAFTVFKIICFLFGLLIWFVGLSMFQDELARENGIFGWFIWGFACVFATVIDFLKFVIKGTREGAAEGATQYGIRDYGSYYTVSNKAASGGLMGFVTSLIAYLLIGPIALGFKLLANFATVIQCIMALRRLNAGNGQ